MEGWKNTHQLGLIDNMKEEWNIFVMEHNKIKLTSIVGTLVFSWNVALGDVTTMLSYDLVFILHMEYHMKWWSNLVWKSCCQLKLRLSS